MLSIFEVRTLVFFYLIYSLYVSIFSQVFHLRTTERALQHCEAASTAPEPSGGPTTVSCMFLEGIQSNK
jgi:hypothetical protein